MTCSASFFHYCVILCDLVNTNPYTIWCQSWNKGDTSLVYAKTVTKKKKKVQILTFPSISHAAAVVYFCSIFLHMPLCLHWMISPCGSSFSGSYQVHLINDTFFFYKVYISYSGIHLFSCHGNGHWQSYFHSAHSLVCLTHRKPDKKDVVALFMYFFLLPVSWLLWDLVVKFNGT